MFDAEENASNDLLFQRSCGIITLYINLLVYDQNYRRQQISWMHNDCGPTKDGQLE